MNKIEVKTYRDQIGHQKYLFQIPLNNGYAYMTLNKSFLRDSKHGGPEKLVIVDTNKFLELWKNAPKHDQKQLAFGNEKVWRKDYKFHHAEKGFSFGPKNPVPLAYLHCYSQEVKKSRVTRLIEQLKGKRDTFKMIPYCIFTNGITRTIWLLANGANCFPVMTDKRSYELLLEKAGIHESEKLITDLVCK